MVPIIRSVIIADDHPIFRMGLRALIESLDGFSVTGEADNGQEAIEFLEKNTPNYAILDIDMPKATGIDVASFIENRSLPVKIIFLTAHTDPVTIEKALSKKNVSILFKESASRDLKQCLAEMEDGKIFISPICLKFIEKRSKENIRISKTYEELSTLTETEQKILFLVSKNLTTTQIAEKLSNSYKTIENHRTNISLKLNLAGPNSLLRYAMENETLIAQIVIDKT